MGSDRDNGTDKPVGRLTLDDNRAIGRHVTEGFKGLQPIPEYVQEDQYSPAEVYRLPARYGGAYVGARYPDGACVICPVRWFPELKKVLLDETDRV